MFSVHNSLSGKTEEFKPIRKGEVGMYHCGPTVYDYAHIGNLRSYVFADILRRTAEYLGYRVKQVVNITDVGHLTSDADSGDDKMVKGLKRDGLPLTLEGLKKLANKYEAAFKEDLKNLNIKTPHAFPRATRYLKSEIALVEELERKGFAYKLADGIYFDTGKLAHYGKLGGLTPLSEAQARVGAEGKKSPRDFVLWKLSKDDHLGFPSPWGVGFPGWHIECSAMSRDLLGQPFDIHTGGIDHIPVHHNNEIAQSEAAYGKPLANYWMHNEFLTIAEGKMAKSEGNFLTLREVAEHGSPLSYRYFLLLSHYRKPTNFAWESFEAAENAYRRLKDYFSTLPRPGLFKSGKVSEQYKKDFVQSIENDLNTPEALAVVWKLVKDDSIKPLDKRATLLDFDKVLGLKLDENEFEVKDIPQEIKKLLAERERARANKDFAKSDALREEIKSKGYTVDDVGGAQRVSRV